MLSIKLPTFSYAVIVLLLININCTKSDSTAKPASHYELQNDINTNDSLIYNRTITNLTDTLYQYSSINNNDKFSFIHLHTGKYKIDIQLNNLTGNTIFQYLNSNIPSPFLAYSDTVNVTSNFLQSQILNVSDTVVQGISEPSEVSVIVYYHKKIDNVPILTYKWIE